MTEQRDPNGLSSMALALRRRFDFAVSSEPHFPWLRKQGHAPYAW